MKLAPETFRNLLAGGAGFVLFFSSALSLSYMASVRRDDGANPSVCRSAPRTRYWAELWAWLSLCVAAVILASALTDAPAASS